jgi:uncharacterized protein YggT (Ycf19 family)
MVSTMWSYRRNYAGVGTHDDLVRAPGTSIASGIGRVLDLLFSALYTLLIVRMILDFLVARKESGFYQLISTLSDPFYGPFKDIVRTSMFDGTHPIVWSLAVAVIAYMLLHGVLRGALRLATRRR